ncbi:PP2C family protein-serine/threonine phosphatase [Aliiroseovarius sp. YM-037]|uniref:PP2C family protein-serine/threonine phosphatase n=1 Tax=Aliiroseovarius sp. YM-037 TaxID=3341728 RepID=UPI003A802089
MNSPTTIIPIHSGTPPGVFGAGLTHPGQVRAENEDTILTDPEGAIWAIADGMGGYGHGDLASETVINHLVTLPDDGDLKAQVTTALGQANSDIRKTARQKEMRALGSTVVVVQIHNAMAQVSWVGDSRAYLMRAGQLRLLTRDHTVVQDLVDDGLLRQEDAPHHPERHVVTRAIGGDERIEVDHRAVPLIAGDWLLLCSDGLTACVHEQTIAALLNDARNPSTACKSLIDEALRRGAPDNVSVITVFVGAG